MDHDGRDARSPTGRGEPRTLGVQRGLDAIAASAGYPRTWEGWLYLATAIDIASRRVVGWATADHLRTDLVEQACGRPSPGAAHPPA